ncbi:hypothetical protein M9H77_21106 [Catharanthus roseus]|uniref:Uncharacterized protein n=1 Tax=Catharanthus roseus TaxID=4058 RepID=A0ACC0ALE9_CATRO|nr:hypothetical protein M9H77_21106 [Catharanthus roseus]
MLLPIDTIIFEYECIIIVLDFVCPQVVDKCDTDELIRKYLPLQSDSKHNTIPLAIQTNFFKCGGIAIAVQVSHKIADATSLATFMNTWAAICREDDKQIISQPNFDVSTSLFPPRDHLSNNIPDFLQLLQVPREKIKTKRMVFNKETLKELKEYISKDPELQVKDPTRVEVVTAWIWRLFLEIHEAKKGKHVNFSAMTAINLRSRMHPPLSNLAFGNLWTGAFALIPDSVLPQLIRQERYEPVPPIFNMATIDIAIFNQAPKYRKENEYGNLVSELRNSIRAIDPNYVNKMREGGEIMPKNASKELILSMGEMQFCVTSSWCRLPLYEVNYGWGKPFWVCTTSLPYKNIALLMDNRDGDGIVAWINMLEEDSSIFFGNGNSCTKS